MIEPSPEASKPNVSKPNVSKPNVSNPEALAPGARRRNAVAARSAIVGEAGRGRRALVVLLPSTDAATVLLLCEQAAELVG